MKSPRQQKVLLFLAASFAVLTSPCRAEWPQDKSDLKPEAGMIQGTLENGLRYVIFPNKFPMPGRASMRLYMNAGSLMEENDQQGMAHFLEHMAFNGSKNFPAGTMVERFQRLGMGFGADTNAHTSFKETVYKLELPRVDEKMLTEGLQLFRDDLDGMKLEEKEIDRERGVILSEKLARDSVEQRIMLDEYNFLMPDALISKRFPIGLEETIKTMSRPRFVDFYEKWYSPRRATVIIAGDVDVALAEGLIKKLFSDAKARRGEAPEPHLGKLTSGRGLIARLKTEMEAPATEISIEAVRPAKTDPDSTVRRREKTLRALADAMVNQRFSKLAKKEDAAFIEAESYNFEMFRFLQSSGVGVKCKPESWKAALALAEQELRRALEHGFTDAELTEAKATVLQTVRVRAEQKDTRKNATLADGIAGTLAAELVFTDPADDLKRVEPMLAEIKTEECLASLRESWNTKDLDIYVGGNVKIENASDAILAVYKESAQKPVVAPVQTGQDKFAYTDFGPAGKVVQRDEVKDLEITNAVFANAVRVNLKKTDFEKNSVRVYVSFGGGKLDTPADKPGMGPFAQSVFEGGALQQHNEDDLRRIFAGRSVGFDFGVGEDSFIFSGKTTPQDLLDELQLVCAFVTAPGYRPEAERQLRKNFDAIYTQLQHTAEGVMTNEVVSFIHSGDPRFEFPKREVMEQRNTAELKAWLTPILRDSYMEIAVVGDIDVDKTLELLGTTFGALPKRAEKKPAYTAERAMKFPPAHDKDFRFTSQIERSYALAYWPTADMSDIQRTRRLSLLGQILDDRLRLKIRQELGETYSPASYHVASDTFTGYGYMTAMATLKPDQVEKVKGMFPQIADAMIKDGISDDEFNRAREPIIQQIAQMRRDNQYWLKNVLRNCQEQPQRLEWSRTMVDDFGKVKKEELATLAKEYLGSGRCLTIGLIPETPPAGAGQ